MSAQLDPEEVQAIADAMAVDPGAKAPDEVAERDFRIPRRLSLEVIKKLDGTLRNLVPSIKRSLQGIVPAEIHIEPNSVREITSVGLFENPVAPFIIARFDYNGAPGWVSWDPLQAITCVQAALGMPPAEGEAVDIDREISFVERRLMARIIQGVLSPIASRFKLDVEGLSIAEKPDDIGSWEDEGPDGDAHRLCIEFGLKALGTESTLTLYLPGFSVGEVELKEEQVAIDPPPVLKSIPVDIHARFDPVEVPLAQLLEIEVGDIIPIAPIRSARVTLNVDNRQVAVAELGRNFERTAVRVTEIIPADPFAEESPTP